MNRSVLRAALNLVVIAGLGCAAAPVARADDPAPLPDWLRDHFEYMTEGSGRWVTDNSAYRNDEEPLEAYATEWTWGVGKRTIRGRLVGIHEGKDTGAYWEYRIFWSPSTNTARVFQFGLNSLFAEGEMSLLEGDEGRHTEMIQTFLGPDGSTWRSRHVAIEKPGAMTTTSYREKDGEWVEDRTYVWNPVE